MCFHQAQKSWKVRLGLRDAGKFSKPNQVNTIRKFVPLRHDSKGGRELKWN